MYIAFGLTLFVIAVLVIRELLIKANRSARKSEFRAFIQEIKEPIDCKRALKLLDKCAHIIEYYGISLREVGFEGNFEALCAQAQRSFGLYVESFRKNLSDNWSHEWAGDEMGLVVPVHSTLEGYAGVQKYAELSRELQHLERKLQRFPIATRALLERRRGFC